MKYFNNEGYADPTAYEALNRIQREESRKNTALWCTSAHRTIMKVPKIR